MHSGRLVQLLEGFIAPALEEPPQSIDFMTCQSQPVDAQVSRKASETVSPCTAGRSGRNAVQVVQVSPKGGPG